MYGNLQQITKHIQMCTAVYCPLSNIHTTQTLCKSNAETSSIKYTSTQTYDIHSHSTSKHIFILNQYEHYSIKLSKPTRPLPFTSRRRQTPHWYVLHLWRQLRLGGRLLLYAHLCRIGQMHECLAVRTLLKVLTPYTLTHVWTQNLRLQTHKL